jgi:hypothetical protein
MDYEFIIEGLSFEAIAAFAVRALLGVSSDKCLSGE